MPRRFVPKFVNVGERVVVEMPYSEVCMHMRVAGKPMMAELLPSRGAVQLYTLDGHMFSAPITTGEAGFFHQDDRVYVYPVEVNDYA